MTDFVITTENAADLPEEFIQENEIGILSLYYTIDGVTYGPDGDRLDVEEFYAKMRAGALPKTQQVNPDQAIQKFRSYLEQGKDILHLALTSAVSGSYNSAKMAAQELMEEFPERTITVIDTLVGTLAEGMVVDKVAQMRKAGRTWPRPRAGSKRTSRTFACTLRWMTSTTCTAAEGSPAPPPLGSAIGIKPILKLDDTGNLVPIAKVRGRKQSIQALVKYMEEHAGAFLKQNDKVYITHGDCLEEAQYLAQLVKEKFGIAKAMINHIGSVIGSHAGPGALALSFMGESK